MYVYKITNNITGAIYIGQTIHELEVRWYGHCHKSSKCTKISRAIKKYKPENFTIKKLITCTNQEELDRREAFCIRIFKAMDRNNYNLKVSGNGGTLSKETREKIALRATGRKQTKETIDKRRQKMLGQKRRPATKEERLRISILNKGRKMTAGNIEKMRKRTTERNFKKVKNIKTGEIINSVKELSIKLNIIYSTLVNQLNGTNSNKTDWIYFL